MKARANPAGVKPAAMVVEKDAAKAVAEVVEMVAAKPVAKVAAKPVEKVTAKAAEKAAVKATEMTCGAARATSARRAAMPRSLQKASRAWKRTLSRNPSETKPTAEAAGDAAAAAAEGNGKRTPTGRTYKARLPRDRWLATRMASGQPS